MDEPDLNQEQLELVSNLSSSELESIDAALLSNCNNQWRKVARVVGTTMMEDVHRIEGIPDLFYAQRIESLVEKGVLLFQGNLRSLRFSEVKLA